MACLLTQESFDGLLGSLDHDPEAAGQRYLEIRRNLVRLFEWRGCSTPDDYADETLNRCARKLADGAEIQDLATYAIGVARMMVLEMRRDNARAPLALEKAPEPYTLPVEPTERPEREECLRCCLGKLSPEDREFILHYYQGDKGDKIKNRQELTARFGVPAGTLRMRALRLREKLQKCAQGCAARLGDRIPGSDSRI